MKLQPNHIQHYPIGGENALRVEDKEGNVYRVFGIRIFSWISTPKIYLRNNLHTETQYKELIDIKPLLRPMSDLYREIDGKIGIMELAKIAFPDFDFDLYRGRAVYGKFEFSYNIYKHYFACSSLGELQIVPNQLALFEYLFDNHYDVFDLIGQNLAIDKNLIQ